MRVLWVVNTLFPAPSVHLGRKPPVIGGWMYGLADELANNDAIKLGVATVQSCSSLLSLSLSDIDYFLIPTRANRGYQPSWERHWRSVCRSFRPDLVHIHGTEYPHGLAFMNACPELPFIVSLQGITSVCARYHYGDISRLTFLRNLTFRDCVRRDSVFHTKNARKSNGVFERHCIQRATIVLGRTSWDEAQSKAIDPARVYMRCNESLRGPFYSSKKWSLKTKRTYSLFMSQAHTPLKGLHKVLFAMSRLLPEFPKLRLRVAGNNILADETLSLRLRRTGFGAYIARLVDTLGLKSVVEFVGPLDEQGMIDEYLRAHIFLCPSAVDNSPNSLGEAQILGVPVVGSYAGGIPDMIRHGETGLLYRFEEDEMLAANVQRILTDDALATRLSRNAIADAEARHDRAKNLSQLQDIYDHVCAGT